jgi:hypothetical protein
MVKTFGAALKLGLDPSCRQAYRLEPFGLRTVRRFIHLDLCDSFRVEQLGKHPYEVEHKVSPYFGTYIVYDDPHCGIPSFCIDFCLIDSVAVIFRHRSGC